jgi:hypothetical protein
VIDSLSTFHAPSRQYRAQVFNRHFYPKRRKNGFCLNAKRRREIERHARHVGAIATEDRSRWLVAWLWHNPKTTDPVGSVIEAAKSMGGTITEPEAAAVVAEASSTPKRLTADSLGRFLGMSYQQRTALGLTTIGARDFSKKLFLMCWHPRGWRT